jgi:hypothetical protein
LTTVTLAVCTQVLTPPPPLTPARTVPSSLSGKAPGPKVVVKGAALLDGLEAPRVAGVIQVGADVVQNQYLPLVITCADNDQLVMLSLRPGNVHAALGADDDLAYLVTRRRRVWPDVALHLRGDCGFGVPGMYEVCERLRVSYTFGLSADAVLQRETEGLLAEAVTAYDVERRAARQAERRR